MENSADFNIFSETKCKPPLENECKQPAKNGESTEVKQAFLEMQKQMKDVLEKIRTQPTTSYQLRYLTPTHTVTQNLPRSAVPQSAAPINTMPPTNYQQILYAA